MKNSRFKKTKERAGLTKPHTNFPKILRPKYPPRKPGHLDKKKKSPKKIPLFTTPNLALVPLPGTEKASYFSPIVHFRGFAQREWG